MNATETTWAVVTAALGSALLTTGGAFGLEWIRSRQKEKVARANELKNASIQMIASAHKFTNRTGALRVNMILRSGLRENLDIVLRHRKPADILEINDYWFDELSALYDAQSTIWLSGDEALIKSAGNIVTAVGELMARATALPKEIRNDPTDKELEKLRVYLRKFRTFPLDPEGEATFQESVRSLARACAEFGQVMRKNLNVKDIDAILRAFPGLLQAKSDASSTVNDSGVEDDP